MNLRFWREYPKYLVFVKFNLNYFKHPYYSIVHSDCKWNSKKLGHIKEGKWKILKSIFLNFAFDTFSFSFIESLNMLNSVLAKSWHLHHQNYHLNFIRWLIACLIILRLPLIARLSVKIAVLNIWEKALTSTKTKAQF